MNNRLPKTLLEKQESERRQTIDKVLRAIRDLETEGCRLTIKNLISYTGLSRSVFAKPHIRTILDEYEIVTAKNIVSKKVKPVDSATDKDCEKDKKIQLLTIENDELRYECELLRGRLFLLMQKRQIQERE
jgi:hypothetical protein